MISFVSCINLYLKAKKPPHLGTFWYGGTGLKRTNNLPRQ